ncbi:hypothetical protein [Marinivivus vitaminiproducens]|uniref:hypothetical protein n=1 Tax=Marinivivus vitaminiproducens TaxID=3035935 RepID=UPI0027A9C6AF|nr:hypothetical protein P4R82_19400 [Geminicoccaceae bacterium SCSIO 64248]
MTGISTLLPSFDGTAVTAVYAGHAGGQPVADRVAVEGRLKERYEAGRLAGREEAHAERATACAALERSVRALVADLEATAAEIRRTVREDAEGLIASALAHALPVLAHDARGAEIAAQLRDLAQRIAAPEVTVRLAAADHDHLAELGVVLPANVVLTIEHDRPPGRVDLAWRGGCASYDHAANLARIQKELQAMSGPAAIPAGVPS